MKLTVKGDLHRGTCIFFPFSYHKSTLFEKKYVIKLITLTLIYMGRGANLPPRQFFATAQKRLALGR